MINLTEKDGAVAVLPRTFKFRDSELRCQLFSVLSADLDPIASLQDDSRACMPSVILEDSKNPIEATSAVTPLSDQTQRG